MVRRELHKEGGKYEKGSTIQETNPFFTTVMLKEESKYDKVKPVESSEDVDSDIPSERNEPRSHSVNRSFVPESDEQRKIPYTLGSEGVSKRILEKSTHFKILERKSKLGIKLKNDKPPEVNIRSSSPFALPHEISMKETDRILITESYSTRARIVSQKLEQKQ